MWQALAREPEEPAGLADVENRLVMDMRQWWRTASATISR